MEEALTFPSDRAREIFTMGFEFYGQEEEGIDKSQSLYSSFAKTEVRHKEYERARMIYKVRPLPPRSFSPLLTPLLHPVRPRAPPQIPFHPALRRLLEL